MALLNKFLPRIAFDSYEDFKENFDLRVPQSFNFARDVVDAIAAESPGKLALLYCNESGDEKRLSFGEVSLLSKRAAAYFAGLGIKQGERVVMMLRRRYEYWICAVALHRLGAVVVPASIQLTKKEIAYRVNTAKAAAVVFIDMPFVLEQLNGIESVCPTLREKICVAEGPARETGAWPQGAHDFCAEYEQCAPHEAIEQQENDAEFIAYFTSGTTNLPKMAIHNKTYPLGHIVTAKYMQRVQNGGLHLTQADSGWAKFGWGNIYGQWICETAILAYDPIRFTSAHMLATMEKYQPTSLCIPPTMYRFLLRDGLAKKHIASVQWFTTAGEPLSPEVNKQFMGISGQPIHEGFGQSEGTPICVSFEWLQVRPGSMGKPSALYDAMIIDKDGNPCEAGEEGEIVIRTDGYHAQTVGLTTGYVLEDGSFVKAYDDLYHTGDVAYADEDGYYWFVGRNDDMIKCSGYRIGPFEIETVLNTHDAIRESAIVGRPDDIRGQVVCAVVSLREGYEPSEELTKELQAFVKKNTAPYKYPRIIEYIDALPKTTSGKIIRKGLSGKSAQEAAASRSQLCS